MANQARVLLVEDSPTILEIVAKRLEVAGYTVLLAKDGDEALAKARAENPDPIILDIMLPKLNGYEVCTMLKQDTRYQKIPILMLTAKAQEADEQLGLECGADAYFRKPFQAEELLAKIRTLIGSSHQAREAQA